MKSAAAVSLATPSSSIGAATLIVSYLEAIGVDYVFGVPGGAIEPLYNAMAVSMRRGGLRPIVARHEAAGRFPVIVVPGVSFVTAASYTLVFGLFVQTLVLTIYLLFRAPDVLRKIFGLWKPSMLAGFMGAFASQFWFLAFALTAAANVRTLALVEVLFAQAVSYYSFKQPISAREASGIVLIVIGVALLVAA